MAGAEEGAAASSTGRAGVASSAVGQVPELLGHAAR